MQEIAPFGLTTFIWQSQHSSHLEDTTMSQTPTSLATSLTVALGLGLRAEFYEHLKDGHNNFAWLEIISENFIDAPAHTLENLIKLTALYKLTFHGVSLSIGGQHPLDWDYLAKIKNLAMRLRPAIISDHLSFSKQDRHNSHDLLPLAYTEESLRYVSERIEQVQDFLGQRLYLENPSAYISYKISSIPEQEFISHLCDSTGCGMILDVNNLYVNRCNLNLDTTAYLNGLKRDHIGYIHMAGHLDKPGVKIDTHGAAISSQVWDLYRETLTRFGPIPSMIERDQNIPPFEEILRESKILDGLLKEAVLAPALPPPQQSTYPKAAANSSWQHSTAAFFGAFTQRNPSRWAAMGDFLREDVPTPSQVGYSVYKQGFPTRLLEVLKGQIPAFSLAVGPETLENLLWAFLAKHPPASYCVDRSLSGFSSFLGNEAYEQELAPYVADSPLTVKTFAELALWEQSVYQLKSADSLTNPLPPQEFIKALEGKSADDLFKARASLQPNLKLLAFDYDIIAEWSRFQKKKPMGLPKQKPTYALAFSLRDQIKTQKLAKWQYRFLLGLSQSQSIGESLMKSGVAKKSILTSGLKALGFWVEKGLFGQVYWTPPLSQPRDLEGPVLPPPHRPQISLEVSGPP